MAAKKDPKPSAPAPRNTKASARASLGSNEANQPSSDAQAPPPAKKQKRAPAASAPPKKASTTTAAAAGKKTKAGGGSTLAPLPPQLPPSDLFVFGSNPFGALGLGEDETVKYRPAQVTAAGLPSLVQVSCGGMHTAALDQQGRVWTWGVNDEGALGRCTEGTSWQEVEEGSKEPSAVPGLAPLPSTNIKAVQVAAGDGFTFALTAEGAVYGCGMFKDDQGGLNGFSPKVKLQRTFALVYEPPRGSEGDRVVKIVAGARHMAALTAGHEVITWGIASQGQLGRLPAFAAGDDGTQPKIEDAFVPAKVTSLDEVLPKDEQGGRDQIIGLGCGLYNTFAIAESGRVVGWGLNNSGQMGMAKANPDSNLIWEPTLIPGLIDISDIRGGEQHTIALTKCGRVLTFGAATYGMLGREAGIDVNGASESYPTPTLVDGIDEGSKVTCIGAGMNVSGCCTEDGSLWLWGSNVNYQLAKGEVEEDAIVPEKMKRTKTFGYRPVHDVSFGGQHAALLAGPQGEAPAPAPAAAPAADGAGPSSAANQA